MTDLSMFDIAGRGAVVTGGASGLGLAIAEVLARNGARVILADVNAAAVETEAARLRAEGGQARGVVVDVVDRDAVAAVMAEAAQWDSGLDIVFANAGISSGLGRHFGTGLLADLDEQRWQQVIDVNLTGVLTTIKAAAAVMNRGSGRIIVTSSVAGHRADPLVGYAYSASKAAVSQLTRTLASELAPHGINLNAIAPGAFLTPIGRANPNNGAMLEALATSTATGRLADPAELQGLALLLASPAASHIVGAVIPVDGGTLVTHR